MTIQIYRKLNTPITRLIKDITDASVAKGVDTSLPAFELTIERAVSNFLGEQGFKYDEYIARKTEDNSIQSAIDEGQVVKNSEMVSFIQTTDGLIKDLKQTKEEAIKVVNQTVQQAKQAVDTLNRTPVSFKKLIDKPVIITNKEVQGMIDKGISAIPQGETGDSIAARAVKMALEEAKTLIPTIEAIENDLPQLGLPIRDSLELLEGEERLDASAIKNLPEVLKENNKTVISGYGGLNLYVGGDKIGATKTINFTGAGVTESKVNGMQTIDIASGGASAFTDLTDVPASYVGQGGKVVAVKADVSGLEFVAATSTDEKVKYDAGDTTAGYVADKVIAGTGISVAEGAGANENKLVITNSNPTPYTLPTAAAATLGGIKIGDRLTIDGSGVLSADVQGGGSGITRTVETKSSDATAGSTASVDYVYFVTGTTTITLPTAVGNTNRYTIKSISGTTVVACNGAETIEGTATIGIQNEDSVDLISNNTEWKVI